MNHLEFTWRGAEQPKMQLSSHSLASWHLLKPLKFTSPKSLFYPQAFKKDLPCLFFIPRHLTRASSSCLTYALWATKPLAWLSRTFLNNSYWRKTIARLSLSKIPLIYDIHSDAWGMARQMGESIPVSWADMCIAFSCDQLTSYVHCIWLFIYDNIRE